MRLHREEPEGREPLEDRSVGQRVHVPPVDTGPQPPQNTPLAKAHLLILLTVAQLLREQTKH